MTGHAVRAVFVGHPLADQMPLDARSCSARAQRAGAAGPGDAVVALLPGSRLGEVTRLGGVFAAAARRLADAERRRVRRRGSSRRWPPPQCRPCSRGRWPMPGSPVQLLDGQSPLALAAADAALVASGTATLETLLCKRPMVVAYRVAPVTAFIVRSLGLVKVQVFLAAESARRASALVPEFLQEAVTARGARRRRWPCSSTTCGNRARLEARIPRASTSSCGCGGGGTWRPSAVLELLRTARAAGC